MCTENIPTGLTDFAFWTLPTSTDHRIYFHCRIQTVAMVMLSTAGTEKLIRNVPRCVTHNTICFLVGYEKHK
jgi:hypothetical protein